MSRAFHFFSGFQIVNHLAENPRISLRGAPDHYRRTAGFLEHSLCGRTVCYIAVPDNGDRYCLHNLCNLTPVCLSRIHLRTGSAMYCNHGSPACLRSLCTVHHILVCMVIAGSKLYRHRSRRMLHTGIHELLDQGRVLHECRALLVVDNLRNRAPHVDVQNIKRLLLDHLGCRRHDLRLVSEELQRNRSLLRVRFHQLCCFIIVKRNCLGTDHLHDNQPRSLLPAQKPEGKIRHSRHRPEHGLIRNHHIPDFPFHRSSILPVTFRHRNHPEDPQDSDAGRSPCNRFPGTEKPPASRAGAF